MKPKTIAAAKFKAECLTLIDEVERTRQELVVTKRGRPVARLVPLAPLNRRFPYGRLGGRSVGDIVGVGEPEWLK